MGPRRDLTVMGRKEQDQCNYYRREKERSHNRMAELKERGVEAMSRYDVEIAHGGDAAGALHTALWLVGNHIRYFTEKVQECDKIPQQATLFDAFSAAPDAHLEAAYEDAQSGIGDWE